MEEFCKTVCVEKNFSAWLANIFAGRISILSFYHSGVPMVYFWINMASFEANIVKPHLCMFML